MPLMKLIGWPAFKATHAVGAGVAVDSSAVTVGRIGRVDVNEGTAVGTGVEDDEASGDVTAVMLTGAEAQPARYIDNKATDNICLAKNVCFISFHPSWISNDFPQQIEFARKLSPNLLIILADFH